MHTSANISDYVCSHPSLLDPTRPPRSASLICVHLLEAEVACSSTRLVPAPTTPAPRRSPGVATGVLCLGSVLSLFFCSFCVGFAASFAPRLSVFCESPAGEPGVCASRLHPFVLPFVFSFWWLRLAPRGCAVFVA